MNTTNIQKKVALELNIPTDSSDTFRVLSAKILDTVAEATDSVPSMG